MVSRTVGFFYILEIAHHTFFKDFLGFMGLIEMECRNDGVGLVNSLTFATTIALPQFIDSKRNSLIGTEFAEMQAGGRVFSPSEEIMRNSKTLTGVAALIASSLMATCSAWATPCVSASVATYEGAGFTCNVGSLIFSNFDVSVLTTGSGSVALGNIHPFTLGNESGLTLSYSAVAPNSSSTTDVAWTYNVSGNGVSIIDAFLALSGNTTGAGQSQVGETLSNGVVLSLSAPGTTTATFAPIASLAVLKDQVNFVGSGGGSAASSLLTNAFSVETVPEPASLALLGSVLVGFGILRRRKA
jgi:hypothetical protein